MLDKRHQKIHKSVALREEGVDRNRAAVKGWFRSLVALREEGVDRNAGGLAPGGKCPVALREEGVDRNRLVDNKTAELAESPSARRAWIEIPPIFRDYPHIQGRPPRGGRG